MRVFIHFGFYFMLLAICLAGPAWGAIEDACTAGSKDCVATVIEADRPYLLAKGKGRLRFRRAPDGVPVLGAILRVSGFSVENDPTCDEGSDLVDSEKDVFKKEEDRWNLGFHIYSLSWCTPFDYIQRNSFVFEKALAVIRAGGLGSPGSPLANDAQLVVIGHSMGGLVTRHALSRMESEGTPHGVSLFISADSPQLGAYLPISVQYANQFFLNSVNAVGYALFHFPPSLFLRLIDDPRVALITGMDTPAARQMLLVHHSRFDGAGPHPDFDALWEEMNGYGFPSAFGMRRVAMSFGMSGRTTRDLEGVVFETGRVTINSKSIGVKYKVGDKVLWDATSSLEFRVPFKMTLTPLTQGRVNQEVFRVDLSNAELRINGIRLLPARVPTLSEIADELGVPGWVPVGAVEDVLDPVLKGARDFLDDSFLDVENLGIRSRSNAPYGYEAGGGGLGDKYMAFHDALAELSFAKLSGGGKSETFIPTRSALAISGDPTQPITEADIASSPFDKVYYHEKDHNHSPFTRNADRWICKEVHDLIRRPFMSRISPSKRPVGGTEFTMTVTGGNFNTSSVVTWNYQGKTDLATEFVDGGTLRAFVPRDLIAELTECTDENGCPEPGFFNEFLGQRAPVTIRVENREALPLQTTSPDWEPTEALRCTHSQPFQIEEVSLPTFTPEQPTSVDVIEAVYANDWRDSCAPTNPQVEVQGNRIVATGTTPITDENSFCLFFVKPYTLNFSFGPLPAGDYALEVRDVRTSFGQETVTPLATRAFSVQNPGPVAASLVPDTVPAGSGDLDLRILGEGFVAGESTAYWNGTPLLTTVESPNSIAAVVPAGTLGDEQSFAEVSVRTNDPNKELVSDPLAFTIGPPELALERLEPESVPIESPDTTITLFGAGFGATTSVEWTRAGAGTSTLQATLIDEQSLTVTLPASELRLPATHLFAVKRDEETSAALGFMVTSDSEPTNFVPVVDAAVNAGSFSGPVAPGGLASLFGSSLASEEALASSFPLPVELSGTRVLVNGVAAPLLYVSMNQINFQVPFETAPGDTEFVIVRDGEAGPSASYAVAESSFGAFQYQREAPGLDLIVTHADGGLVTPESPARLNETVVVYGTGVGALTNPPATGQPAPSDSLAVCEETPRAFLSGEQFSEEAVVDFCGLTPGFAGLIQINIRLPQNRPPGAESNLGLLFPGREIQSWPLHLAQ